MSQLAGRGGIATGTVGRTPAHLVVLLFLLALLAAPAVANEAPAARCGGGNPGIPPPQVPPPPDDLDCDFVKDNLDNCPPLGYDDLRTRNPNQDDSDQDGVGDWCEADDDSDGFFDWTDHKVEYESTRVQEDNCRTVFQTDQADDDHNGVGNLCEFDTDADGHVDTRDNCARTSNPDQADLEGDGIGDVCDSDDDGDFSRDRDDNCPRYPNPDQLDADGDGIGTLCDDDETPPTPTPPPTATVMPDAGATPSVVDRQAPRVTLAVRSTQRVAEVADALVVRLRCSEACLVKADLLVSRAVARRLKLRGTTVVGTGTARVEDATTTYAFVRFHERVRARLFKLARTALTLRVAVTDPAGNVRRETERLILTRR